MVRRLSCDWRYWRGTVNVSVQINGTVAGLHHDMSYTLFSSSNPFDAQAILDALTIDDQILRYRVDSVFTPGERRRGFNP